ncbi:MAG: YajQ family cyclic di-GMP-binding protein [Vampirovibrionales bacterium]|nr:YajQ family cyclic di-GMP-binding protein [Vampirovibrionales bacterium]
MAKDCSFDVVSEFDQQELVNAVDQTCRDLTARYDLKDSNSTVTLEKDSIAINTTDEYSLNSIFEILAIKVTKRGLSPLILERGKVEESLGGRVREHVKLRRGIETDLAKKIVAEIKSAKLKVQASIQGDQVRVSGKDKDDLQQVIAFLRPKGEEWNVPLQFTNYR